jgi:SAM-dependent methyltransferase
MVEADFSELGRLYETRFSPAEREAKSRVWAVLCRHFFCRFVRPTDRVLDLAAGYCEFINHVDCAEKYAFDANPQARRFAAETVKFVVGDCRDLSSLPPDFFDAIFVSNFFEHLESKRDMDTVLRQAWGRLRRGGRLLVLQPNIRFLDSRYWDFYDHQIPITHLSLREALLKNGFTVELLIPKFLPFTSKSRLPTAPWLVWLYLKLTPAHWLFGKQMFAVAVRPAA